MSLKPDPSRTLDALATVHLTVLHWQQKLSSAVIQARKAGATWQQVGECFGKGRQYAWEAFHELVPDESGTVTPSDDDDGI